MVVVSTNQWLKLTNSTFPCMYIPFPPTDPGIKFPILTIFLSFDNLSLITGTYLVSLSQLSNPIFFLSKKNRVI